MYVVATARSGATAFCLNYAFEHGIEYGGELSVQFVNPGMDTPGNPYINTKQATHETGIQPTYTPNEFLSNVSELKNPSKIFLVPAIHGAHLLADADFYMTRKNVYNIFKSRMNFLLKTSPQDMQGSIGSLSPIFYRNVMELRALVVMLQYCKNNDKQVTWYEDTFTRDTEYTYLDAWENRNEFLGGLQAHVSSIDFEYLNPNIIV